MVDYREHTQTIEIPKGTGTRGFLRAIEEILKLDRVQGINIDARGQVSYTRYVREDDGDMDVARLQFETLMPYAVVRNGRIDEIVTGLRETPALVVARMFAEVSKQKLYPLAFVTGANTTLFDWLWGAGLEIANKDEFFGLPVHRDRLVDDYVLIIAAAYGRGANFTDTQQSFKIVMPQRTTDNALSTRQGDHQGKNPPGGDPRAVSQVGVPGRGANGTPPRNSGGGNPSGGGSAAE